MNGYGLIGYPLGHSFSKQYFEKKFAAEGLNNCSFDLFPIETIEEFPGLIKSHPSLLGLAVTIPYKQLVMRYISNLHPVAKEVGAINCIRISGDSLTGYNTDIIGFEKSLVPLLKSHHHKALV